MFSNLYTICPTIPWKIELFSILWHYRQKTNFILMWFYVIGQHKVLYNCEVKRRFYLVFIFFLFTFFTN